MHKELATPVLFLIFNRPDTTKRVFNEIRKAKPSKFFVAADGPRPDRRGENEKCEEVRRIIDKGVDWDCKVHKLYRDQNLGCKIAVSSAIDWFFENVEEGIILEDDCLPHPSFFRYCQELLKKYRDDERIMCISGGNFQNGITRGRASYYFSVFNHVWGWASWHRAWRHFDIEMKIFPEFKSQKRISDIFNRKNEQMYWMDKFQSVHDNKIDSWCFPWLYACWLQNGLTCLPNVNLISNIGFGKESTHTSDESSPFANLPTEGMKFSLVHPNIILANKEADKYTNRHHFRVNANNIMFRNIIKILKIMRLHNIVRRTYHKTKIFNGKISIKNFKSLLGAYKQDN